MTSFIRPLNDAAFGVGCDMSKFKNTTTGEGYLGETMVHRLSHEAGVVDNVIEGREGWQPQITLKLADGSFKRGKLSDFREPSASEIKRISPEAGLAETK